jgi:hypothetical protein
MEKACWNALLVFGIIVFIFIQYKRFITREDMPKSKQETDYQPQLYSEEYDSPSEEEIEEYYSDYPEYKPGHSHDNSVEVMEGFSIPYTTYARERDLMGKIMDYAKDIVDRGGDIIPPLG